MNLTQDEIDYPRDVFGAIIEGNSPYAFYLFQWVPYQTDARRWRLKMLHDVKTFDGRIEYGIWPNGGHCGSFKDEEVEFIRLSRDQICHTYEDPRDPKPKVTVISPPVTQIPDEVGKQKVDVEALSAALAKRERKKSKRSQLTHFAMFVGSSS